MQDRRGPRDRVTPRRKRVLIAGAAGFIGSHLTERLLAEGHVVLGVDNLMTGDLRNLDPFLGHPRFKFVIHDVVHPLRTAEPLDWVMHFASPASPPRYLEHPVHTLRSNAEGTYRLLKLARAKGACLLFASTSEVYGDPYQHPQREDYWGHVNPNGPRSVYDEGKRYAEAMVSAFHRTWNMPVRLVRIFNTYGPRMQRDDGRVVANFVNQALCGKPLTVYGDGSQTRSFQFVDDLVEGLLRMMEVDYAGPVNLGNPQECTVLELAKLVKEITRTDSPIVYGPLPRDDPRQRRPDITLAGKLLGWRPGISIEDGLRRTIEYFREQQHDDVRLVPPRPRATRRVAARAAMVTAVPCAASGGDGGARLRAVTPPLANGAAGTHNGTNGAASPAATSRDAAAKR